MEIETLLQDSGFLRNLLATGIVLLLVVILRVIALRFVRRVHWPSNQMQLRWMVQVRWASLLLLFLGLTVVWASELRTFAISVAAIAAAIVIATKELILCFSGALLRASAGSYTVGDRVAIGGIRGDVIDIGALTTTLLEVGPWHRRTGRALILPNALLLSQTVTNETFTHAFVLHIISVPVGKGEPWEAAEARLLEVAREVCAPYLDEARRDMQQTAREHGLESFLVDPNASLQVLKEGEYALNLRVPARAQETGQIEQQILRRFFAGAVSAED
ncbi:MAG: mechanosensitive ion channel family protein [Deltaproteobacteria bacterium]|nr:mechanosensitive ion channel family protein [Deltaproteobacteria bacterium]